MSNGPRPVLRLDYATPDADLRWRRHVRFGVALSWLICCIGWLIMLIEIESVMVSGSLLFAVSLAMLVRSLQTRDTFVAVLSAAHIGICVAFVLLVILLAWGPDDAETPFAIIGGAYLGASLLPTVIAFSRLAVV